MTEKNPVERIFKHPYRKCRLIHNPSSGQGAALHPLLKQMLGIKQVSFDKAEEKQEYISRVVSCLEHRGIRPQVLDTRYAGHATELAKKAVEEGADLVIAVGGDGTINEVVNGLADSQTALGVIPLGTANVFALEMGLPHDLEEACELIASGKQRVIDLGICNRRYFTCMAGVGFDAHVVKKADSSLKKVYGALAYLFVMIAEILTYKFKPIVIRLDGDRKILRGFFLVVGNGRYYGGSLVMAEKADMEDGLLDVCLFKQKSVFSVLGYLLRFPRGDIEKYMDVQHFQCRRVEVLKRGRHPVHVDAEYLTKTPVTILACPAHLKVAC